MKKKQEVRTEYVAYYPLPDSLIGYGGATCDYCFVHIPTLPHIVNDENQGRMFTCQPCADEQKARKQLAMYGL